MNRLLKPRYSNEAGFCILDWYQEKKIYSTRRFGKGMQCELRMII